MTDDIILDDEFEAGPFDNLIAGDVFRDATGREFEIQDVNYTFDIVKVVYLDNEDDASIRFADWLASPPTLIREGELPETNVVLGEPEPDEAGDNGWGDDEDDEEARWEEVKEIARAAARRKFDHVYSQTKDYDYAMGESNLVAQEIVTNYQVQRLARD